MKLITKFLLTIIIGAHCLNAMEAPHTSSMWEELCSELPGVLKPEDQKLFDATGGAISTPKKAYERLQPSGNETAKRVLFTDVENSVPVENACDVKLDEVDIEAFSEIGADIQLGSDGNSTHIAKKVHTRGKSSKPAKKSTAQFPATASKRKRAISQTLAQATVIQHTPIEKQATGFRYTAPSTLQNPFTCRKGGCGQTCADAKEYVDHMLAHKKTYEVTAKNFFTAKKDFFATRDSLPKEIPTPPSKPQKFLCIPCNKYLNKTQYEQHYKDHPKLL